MHVRSVLFVSFLVAASPVFGAPQTPGARSAFFGLDDALPAVPVCPGARGGDGIPVVLDAEVVDRTLDAGDFRVTTRSGVRTAPRCATLLPAAEEDEDRTVLLIGEFGDDPVDPPARATIVGDLRAEGSNRRFRGSAAVTPLAAGPAVVFAERTAACPDAAQAVRIVWAGGVQPAPGVDTPALLDAITVTLGSGANVNPVAVDDLDRDNNQELCLDVAGAPVRVRVAAGVLVDPNGDPNPATTIRLEGR